MSSGIQKTIADGLRYLLNNVEDGHYGVDDDAFSDIEVEAFEEDLEEVVTNLLP